MIKPKTSILQKQIIAMPLHLGPQNKVSCTVNVAVFCFKTEQENVRTDVKVKYR